MYASDELKHSSEQHHCDLFRVCGKDEWPVCFPCVFPRGARCSVDKISACSPISGFLLPLVVPPSARCVLHTLKVELQIHHHVIVCNFASPVVKCTR